MEKTNNKKPNYKVIFTLRLKQELKKRGFEPILEMDNLKKPGYKCWVYELSFEFERVFSELVRKKED